LQYRLSIRKPTPDFSLVVFDAFPSADGKAPATSGAVSLRKGGTYELTVYAYRRDGHNEAIEVHGESLPAGISCRPSVIGAGQNVAKLVLTAAADAAEQVSPIQIQGISGSAETQLKRSATVATLVHDAINGLPRTARLAEQLVVGVMKDDQPFSIVTDIAAADYSQDQQLLIPVRLVKRNGFDGKVDLSFYNVPAETDAPAFAIEPGKDSAVARIYFKEKAPVLSNTLLLQGTSAVPYRRNPWLAERAKARVTEAEAALTAGQTRVTAAETALAEQQKKVVELTEQVKKLGEELAAYTTQQQQLRDTYNKAVAEQVVALQAVTKAQAQVAAVKAASDLPPDQLQAALQSLKAAADSLEAAAAGVEQQATAAEALAKQVAAVKEMEAVKAGEKTTAEAGVVQRMKDVEAAQAMLATVAKDLETAKAAKAAADESLKKAEEATKPNNVNVRVVSDAIVVRIHASPAKLAGALPDNGSIKRGASVAAKVTVTRKNNFTGAMKLQLVLPEGITAVKSDPVELAADQNEATLTVTAAADAPPGDLANVVIRATGELAGRAASTDLPVAVKIVE
jgi:chemotaxis protein histidine kinase CheA